MIKMLDPISQDSSTIATQYVYAVHRCKHMLPLTIKILLFNIEISII